MDNYLLFSLLAIALLLILIIVLGYIKWQTSLKYRADILEMEKNVDKTQT